MEIAQIGLAHALREGVEAAASSEAITGGVDGDEEVVAVEGVGEDAFDKDIGLCLQAGPGVGEGVTVVVEGLEAELGPIEGVGGEAIGGRPGGSITHAVAGEIDQLALAGLVEIGGAELQQGGVVEIVLGLVEAL